ncbi:MAG TPA: PAS domain-containing protein [Allosphingosinicella sp.]|uniref:PAS domain-containing protein n=1 Tax=Allosphingosinicella sp. TaxID=2823234 RepID=UPI002EDA27D3
MSSDAPAASSSADYPFLAEGGEMGALMRAHDWAATPLGSPEGWPQSLRTAVSILLTSKFPMFLVWGPKLPFLYNDGYAPILGEKHPGALGRPFRDVWPEIWDDIGPIVDRALAGEATYWENLPLVMERKGFREDVWFTFSYSPLLNEAGNIPGMFCACFETTATVLSERRRIDEAERLRQLFHSAPGFIAVLRGPDHVFEIANASYLQLVGHRDLIGKTARQALPEIAGQGFFELLDRVYASGKPFTGHSAALTVQRTPDATPEERRLDFVYQPITNEAGTVTGIFVEGYDVTERFLAEEALRESEERFRLIADSAPVPMWVTRLDRKRSFVNRAYVDFLGITYEEAVDFDWRTILHPDDAERVLRESVAGEASLKPFTLEARYKIGSGEWRWFRSLSQPRWGPNGEHVGFIGVANDITQSKEAEATLRAMNETLEKRVEERTADVTAALDRLQAEVSERMRAEEALRQAQKMEAVGQLTGGIAHDFNNLLTPILGGLEIIASRMDDPRLKRIAETALESTRRGAKLTSQLLAFSRIQRISMAPVAVNDVIANMKDLLRHTIGSSIAVKTKLGREVKHGICDANQLENAVLNLAINARDAMPEGGTLTISTDRADLSDGPDVEPGSYICVSVADTGAGMAEEVRARATEPFFSTKPLGKGTGLGLAQVYGIARQSGGTLRIESEEGKGTIVRILLPEVSDAGPAKSAVIRAEPEPSHVSRGASILLIDDDPEVRDFLTDSLQSLGHSVVAAGSGQEGLERLAESKPDLVLLDYAMPAMHGAEVARAVHAAHPHLPIIFVTGYAESEQIDAASGPDVAVLKKPFTIADLTKILAEKLHGTSTGRTS